MKVEVVNGSGVPEWGEEVMDALVSHGFVAAGPPTEGDRSDYPLTQVRWAPGATLEAVTTAAYLGTGNVVAARPVELSEGNVLVIVGRDWEGLVAPAKTPPDPTATTTTTPRTTPAGPEAGPGPETTLAPETTTTTVPSPDSTATVPVDPLTGGPLVGCPTDDPSRMTRA